jgi:thiamine-phosphate pyrophosphorylase
MALHLKNNDLATYAISDQKALSGGDLTAFAGLAAASNLDLLQIREKELPDNQLIELVRECVNSSGAMKILVNDRLDIALAAGADGVHLTTRSVSPTQVRAIAGADFIIGCSTHSLAEAEKAQSSGADFITFGPIFHTPSKAEYGPPVGIDALRQVLAEIDIPVFPLGGISCKNISELLLLPIAGIAAISLFQNADSLPDVISSLQQRREC